MALRFEFASQFAVIINLTVEGQYVAITNVHHRLMTARTEINDTKSIVTNSETSGRVDKSSSIIWPPVRHCVHHTVKSRRFQSNLRIHQPTAYRTHLVQTAFLRCIPIAGGLDQNGFVVRWKPCTVHRGFGWKQWYERSPSFNRAANDGKENRELFMN
jgi:hypothetical protein